MTTSLDLNRNAFVYAQHLDNKGGFDFWRSQFSEMLFEQLTPNDIRLPLMHSCVDEIINFGCHWPTKSEFFLCQIMKSGKCLITIKPITLDIDGRKSPVLIIFDAFGPSRKNIAKTLQNIPRILDRQTDPIAMGDIEKFCRIFRWPAWILYIRTHILRIFND